MKVKKDKERADYNIDPIKWYDHLIDVRNNKVNRGIPLHPTMSPLKKLKYYIKKLFADELSRECNKVMHRTLVVRKQITIARERESIRYKRLKHSQSYVKKYKNRV